MSRLRAAELMEAGAGLLTMLQVEGVAAQLYSFDMTQAGHGRIASWHTIMLDHWPAEEYRRQARKMLGIQDATR